MISEIKRKLIAEVRWARAIQPRDCNPKILLHYLDWLVGLALKDAYDLGADQC